MLIANGSIYADEKLLKKCIFSLHQKSKLNKLLNKFGLGKADVGPPRNIETPKGTFYFTDLEYAHWTTKNTDQFAPGTYLVASWDMKTGEVLLYPGMNAKWKDGSLVDTIMDIRVGSHVKMEERVKGELINPIPRFLYAKPFKKKGGGVIIKVDHVVPHYKSGVLNGKLNWAGYGQMHDEFRADYAQAISNSTNRNTLSPSGSIISPQKPANQIPTE
ncbi:hypothetical protein N9N67_05305 [Bacteriovoracaceae bacterium]|nr:hypothetical protein [Bacteriovoracaceae bacterium]